MNRKSKIFLDRIRDSENERVQDWNARFSENTRKALENQRLADAGPSVNTNIGQSCSTVGNIRNVQEDLDGQSSSNSSNSHKQDDDVIRGFVESREQNQLETMNKQSQLESDSDNHQGKCHRNIFESRVIAGNLLYF